MSQTIRAYGYARVSTGAQLASTLSVREQVRRIIAYADLHQMDMGAVTSVDIDGSPFESRERIIIEAESASKHPFKKRPGGRKILERVDKGGAVVGAKLDRMFRNTLDALQTVRNLEREGVSVHVMDIGMDTSTPSGKLLLTLLAAVAEWESNRISERTSMGLRAKRSRNYASFLTRPIPGFILVGAGRDKRLVPDDTHRWFGDFFYELWISGMSPIVIRQVTLTHAMRQPLNGKVWGEWDIQEAANIERLLRAKEAEFLAAGRSPVYADVATAFLEDFVASDAPRSALHLKDKTWGLLRNRPHIPRQVPLRIPPPTLPSVRQGLWSIRFKFDLWLAEYMKMDAVSLHAPATTMSHPST